MKKSVMMSVLGVGLLSAGLAFATPQQAVDQVRTNAVQVLTILKKANGSNDAAVRKQAEEYATPYFDFNRMTELAVGHPWKKATGAQKQALTAEFRNLLIRIYSSSMLKFKNAKVEVKDQPLLKQGGREIVVTTQISANGSHPVVMSFAGYENGGKYRVYNVSVDGASLVTVYRSQFNEIVKTKGIDGLIAYLKQSNERKNGNH